MTKKVAAIASRAAQKENLDKRNRVERYKKVEEPAIPRDVFLAGRVLCMASEEPPPVYCLKAVSYVPSSPATRSQPPGLAEPPGLELPGTSEDGAENNAETQPKQIRTTLEQSDPEPEQYKVLLQNLADAMMNESMLRVMLEEADVNDILEIKCRNGKVLLTFASYESVHKTITHCNGRLWSNSDVPVVALYVRTVKKTQPDTVVTPIPIEAKALSADAPTFVPGSLQIPTKPLSAEAAVFIPADCKAIRDRCISTASTESGASVSSEKGSDSEPDVPSYFPLELEVPIVCT